MACMLSVRDNISSTSCICEMLFFRFASVQVAFSIVIDLPSVCWWSFRHPNDHCGVASSSWSNVSFWRFRPRDPTREWSSILFQWDVSLFPIRGRFSDNSCLSYVRDVTNASCLLIYFNHQAFESGWIPENYFSANLSLGKSDRSRWVTNALGSRSLLSGNGVTVCLVIYVSITPL